MPISRLWLRTALPLSALLAATACHDSEQALVAESFDSGAAETDVARETDGDAADAFVPSITKSVLELGEPEQVADGTAHLLGLTDDERAVFRRDNVLYAAELVPEASAAHIAEKADLVHIRGSVVFALSNVDYTTNLGELVVWTPAHGARAVGTAFVRADMVAAAPDGASALFAVPAAESTADLVVADPALASRQTLIGGAGRGSDTTCRMSFGFIANDRIAVSWCNPESSDATLNVFTRSNDGSWRSTTIATDAQSQWATDATGSRIFFTTRASRANVYDKGAIISLDRQVAWGMLTPDGATAFYVVGDQLRRSAIPDVFPIPIVLTGFRQRVAFNATFSHVLYSSQISYEGGTRRDLWLSPTADYNQEPSVIVAEPSASISRTAFTDDGNFALYLTDLDEFGAGTLHARSIWTGEERVFPNVDTVSAAGGAVIVFSDDRTPPPQYPPLADLKILDLATEGEPKLIQAQVIDGRDFQLTDDVTRVVYSLPVAGDAAARQGLYVQRIRPAE